MIDHDQQLGIDFIALGQRFIEVHRAHHGAQVGGRQLHDRDVEVGHLVSRLAGIEHLKEHDGVDPDHRVVTRDDLLPRNVEHLLHHVDLVTDAIDERDDHMQPRLRGQGIFAQPLNGVDIALPHHTHAHQQEDEYGHQQENQRLKHHTAPCRSSWAAW